MYTSNGDGSAAYDPANVQPMKWQPSPGDWFDCWAGLASGSRFSESGAQPSARRFTIVGAAAVDKQRGRRHPFGGQSRTRRHARRRIGCKIFLDGKEIYSKLIGPAKHEDLDLKLDVKKESKLDFASRPARAPTPVMMPLVSM